MAEVGDVLSSGCATSDSLELSRLSLSPWARPSEATGNRWSLLPLIAASGLAAVVALLETRLRRDKVKRSLARLLRVVNGDYSLTPDNVSLL